MICFTNFANDLNDIEHGFRTLGGGLRKSSTNWAKPTAPGTLPEEDLGMAEDSTGLIEIVNGDHDPPHAYMVVAGHGFLIDLSRASGIRAARFSGRAVDYSRGAYVRPRPRSRIST
jgi:hypothetical protein